jgi:triosephosphate isomerase
MNKLFIINWKMNGSIELLDKFLFAMAFENVILAPPLPHLAYAKRKLDEMGGKLMLAAQDCSVLPGYGSYTGEVSAEILKDSGVGYVFVGHSERRIFLSESSEVLNRKLKNATQSDLRAIYCVSEDYASRIEEETLGVDKSMVLVAYEPSKAIGSSNTPSSEIIEEIAINLKMKFGFEKVLYGGGVNSSNISETFAINAIDGVLVGKAGLKLEETNYMVGVCKTTG